MFFPMSANTNSVNLLEGYMKYGHAVWLCRQTRLFAIVFNTLCYHKVGRHFYLEFSGDAVSFVDI